jgi:hypothetical protein
LVTASSRQNSISKPMLTTNPIAAACSSTACSARRGDRKNPH